MGYTVPVGEKYQRRPVVVRAVQWYPGKKIPEVRELSPEAAFIDTLDGEMQIYPGYWIIKDKHGAFAVNDETFRKLYEPAA